MTFYEAALRVLEAAGSPLSFQEITERSIQQNLLSHIGKTPELTMLSRLLAMARRKTDRKVVVTQKDTFALADWALPEEPDALTETLKSEIHEEDNLPPLRPAERHPEPRAENVRVAGRNVERKRARRDEDEGRRRKRRFPPVPEVVFEILSDSGSALKPSSLMELARERGLVSDELTEEKILTALLEDNQRRIDAGRRPQFVFDRASGELGLERAGAPSEAPPLELQAAFAAALGIPMEGGRPVLPRAAAATAAAAVAAGGEELDAAKEALKNAAREARRASARALRRKLTVLDAGTFEKAMVKVLHGLGFRELKVARRSKEGPLLTARKREGSLELRWAIRLLRGTNTIDRRAIQDLRKDVGHYSAQVALLACPGEVRGEARSEATSGGALVFVWGGEALAEKFFEAAVGVNVARIETYEVDDGFFEAAKLDAEESQRRREERTREKQPRRSGEAGAGTESEAGAVAAALVGEGGAQRPERAASSAAEGGEREEEGEKEGEEDLEEAEAYVSSGHPEGGESAQPGQPGQPGERHHRRRRRRGRRGRGPRAEGAQGAAGAPGTPGAPSTASASAPASAPADSSQAASAAAQGEVAPAAPAPSPGNAEPAAPPPPSGAGEGSAG